MALLQVRDFPQETYQILARVAKEQNRTVPQQVIFLLTSILNADVDKNGTRRRRVLDDLDALELHLPFRFPSPADLVLARHNGATVLTTDKKLKALAKTMGVSVL